jgi:hypothetical protein
MTQWCEKQLQIDGWQVGGNLHMTLYLLLQVILRVIVKFLGGVEIRRSLVKNQANFIIVDRRLFW